MMHIALNIIATDSQTPEAMVCRITLSSSPSIEVRPHVRYIHLLISSLEHATQATQEGPDLRSSMQ